ncbi:hypothetical protein D3C80_2113570 [compost metagenome]
MAQLFQLPRRILLLVLQAADTLLQLADLQLAFFDLAEQLIQLAFAAKQAVILFMLAAPGH